jgi:hypothetical protein
MIPTARLTSALALTLLCTVVAVGQEVAPPTSDTSTSELVLTNESEEGFKAFRERVRHGELRSDLHEATIGISRNSVQLELSGKRGQRLALRLSPLRSAAGLSRYFDVEPLENATASDCARVGKLLDEVFATNPFRDLSLRDHAAPEDAHRASTDRARPPARYVVEAHGHLGRPASFRYTVAVIVVTALGLLASIVILCLPVPPEEGSVLGEARRRKWTGAT